MAKKKIPVETRIERSEVVGEKLVLQIENMIARRKREQGRELRALQVLLEQTVLELKIEEEVPVVAVPPQPQAAPVAPKPKRRYSKEARKKLSEAAKRRWAQAQAAGKKRLG